MDDDQGYDPVYDRLDDMDREPDEPDDWGYHPAPASWPRYDRRMRHAEWQRRDRASRPAVPPTPEQVARAARRAARRPFVPSPF